MSQKPKLYNLFFKFKGAKEPVFISPVKEGTAIEVQFDPKKGPVSFKDAEGNEIEFYFELPKPVRREKVN